MTVSVVEPQIEPAHALMVVVPPATPKACPELVASLLMVATAVLEELQVTAARVWWLPPLKLPVARNAYALPIGTHAWPRVIDWRPLGVEDVG